MSELVETPGTLMARVAAVRAALAASVGRAPDAVELRVAASVTQLGLTARLLAPVLAVALTSGGVLDIGLERLRWKPVLGGAFPLSLPRDRLVVAPAPDASYELEHLASAIGRRVLDGPVTTLLDTTRASVSISSRVLWGNVASAINGAASMIATGRPDLARRVSALTAALFEQPSLQGTAIGSVPRSFRRRSCCLIYRASPNRTRAICGDCVLSVSASRQ